MNNEYTVRITGIFDKTLLVDAESAELAHDKIVSAMAGLSEQFEKIGIHHVKVGEAKSAERTYYYGMKARGCSIGCQPKTGFVSRVCDSEKEHNEKMCSFYDVVIYDRELTDVEIEAYDLEKIEF